MVRRRTACAVLVTTGLLIPSFAHAQAERSGVTFTIGVTTPPVDNVDVAHDPINDRFLAVAHNGGGDAKFIEARLLSGNGTLISTFTANQSGIANVQSPRVAFSPDIAGGGGYLVTWHQGVPFSMVRGRIFNVNGGAVTGDFDIAVTAISPATQSNWTMGAAVAYSTVSREFLVAWMGGYGSTNDIFYARVSTTGTLLLNGGTALNTLVTAGTPDWERDPSVTYNPDQNVFYIGYGGYDEIGHYGYAGGQRVQSGTGALIGTPQRFGAALSTYVPAVTYNTQNHQYLLGWYNRTSTFAAVYGVVLNGSDASQVGAVRVLSGYYAAYDALDIDYNTPSGQYMLVTHGGGAKDWEDAGVTILSDGNAYDNGFFVTDTTPGEGNFNPRMASAAGAKRWLVVTSHRHGSVFGQFVSTNAGCTVALSATTATPGGGGGSATVNVTGDPSCAWTATSNAPWITITGGSSGAGNGIVSYQVAVNTGATRVGTFSIGGQTFTVTQTGCSYSLDYTSISLGAAGATNAGLGITASPGCSWTAMPGSSWIATSSTGTGNGTVLWTAVRNPNPSPRTGAFSVGGQYFTVFQAAATANDFNDDGRPDLLFHNSVTGEVASWFQNIGQQTGTGLLDTSEPDLNWQIVAMNDMNRDGQSDIVWRNTSTGALRVWVMNGPSVASVQPMAVGTPVPPNWNVVGSGDFNRDGAFDILLQDQNGDVGVWYFTQAVDGSFTRTGAAWVAQGVGPSWKVRGVADFNRDNFPDIVWQDTSAGWLAVWFMQRLPSGVVTYTDTRYFTINKVTDPNWKIVAVGDFNNDLRADLVWQHMTGGWLAMWLTWDNIVLDTRYITSMAGTPLRLSGVDLNWKIVGPR